MSPELDEVAAALPNYEVGGELGRGGWGVVLAGRHRQLDRQVAIKQLPRAFAADETVRRRFLVEAKLMASLDHPHIVPVYDFVEQDGLCLLVMELLPGGTVWSRFTSDGFTPTAAAATGLACLAGLQAAHAKHFLHRDIKPENLMFSAGGVLKVTDFGIAKMVGGEDAVATRAGEVIGTPAYIAPEQARGGALSPATDIYALATMLYELLSGVLPFADDGDAMALLFKHAFEAPVPLADQAPQTPAAVAAVVMSGLATDPAERPSSAEEFGLALARACTASWGPGWLTAEGMPVMGAANFVAATESSTGMATRPSTPPGPATGVAGAVDDIPPPPPAPPSSPAAPASAVHPPVGARRATGPVLADLGEPAVDLVPLKDVVVPPPSARWPFLAAAALFIGAVVFALAGLGSAPQGGTLRAGMVAVGGIDPTSGHVVPVDLTNPVPIATSPTAPQADHVRLALSLLGRRVTSGAALMPATGARTATVNLGGHFLLGGAFTGTISLLHQGRTVGTYDFGVRTTQSAFASVSGAAPFLLFLFLLAYAESFLRSLRRGKRSVTAVPGLTVIGALFGADVVGLVWVLAKHRPTLAALVACAVLGAAAGLAAGLGGARIGRQRRYKRAQRRERRLGAA